MYTYPKVRLRHMATRAIAKISPGSAPETLCQNEQFLEKKLRTSIRIISKYQKHASVRRPGIAHVHTVIDG